MLDMKSIEILRVVQANPSITTPELCGKARCATVHVNYLLDGNFLVQFTDERNVFIAPKWLQEIEGVQHLRKREFVENVRYVVTTLIAVAAIIISIIALGLSQG